MRVRASLTLLPFRVVRERLKLKLSKAHAGAIDTTAAGHFIRQTVVDVRAASRYVPAASCLTQAITLQLLLHKAGVQSDLRIGVARDPHTGAFLAHAWLDRDGVTLIGGELKAGFTAMTQGI